MDIKKMLADQKELDDKILSNAGIEKYPLENIKLALLVELGELANEWQGFKHWKKHREINREKLLEEFADCLHFALSLQNYRQGRIYEIKEIRDAVEIFGDGNISSLFIDTYRNISENGYVSPLYAILILGFALGITEDEMEQSYYKKNQVNYKRQEEGY